MDHDHGSALYESPVLRRLAPVELAARRRNETGQPHNQVSQMLVISYVPGYERAIQKETFLHVA